MLKGFLSAFSADLSKRTNNGIEITVNIEMPELKEELDEYKEFMETYGVVPQHLSELPLLGLRIIKKKGNKEIEKGNLKETTPKNLKALRRVAMDTGWFLPDIMEISSEINAQGFSYPESINILKEVVHIVSSDYQLDWRPELTKIIEKRQQYIQEYERRKSFEKALHYGLETTKEIKKKEIEDKLKDVNGTIHYWKDLYAGPHYCVASSQLSLAKKRKHILLERLAIMDKEITENMKLSEVEEDMDTEAYNATAKIQNARIEETIGTKGFTKISEVIVNRSGKRYSLKAKALKNDWGFCRPWIDVRGVKSMRCPKCGFKMRHYQTQIQERSGYKTDIELQAFRCSNPRCGFMKNIKKKVLPINALFIEERDGSMIKIR